MLQPPNFLFMVMQGYAEVECVFSPVKVTAGKFFAVSAFLICVS